MGHIEIIPFSEEDEQNLYGNRVIAIGKCFKSKSNNYYQQRKDHVLHINHNCSLVNKLHPGYFNVNDKKFEEIEYSEFENAAKKLIYDLELDKFWNK